MPEAAVPQGLPNSSTCEDMSKLMLESRWPASAKENGPQDSRKDADLLEKTGLLFRPLLEGGQETQMLQRIEGLCPKEEEGREDLLCFLNLNSIMVLES